VIETFFLTFGTTVVDIVCLVVELILGFFRGISFVPFDERLSDVEVICLF